MHFAAFYHLLYLRIWAWWSVLAWFGGTDKGSKVGRALIAGGGTGRPARTERLRLEAGLVEAPPPSKQLLPVEAESSYPRSAAGQTCPFSRVIPRLTPTFSCIFGLASERSKTTRQKCRKKKPINELRDTFITPRPKSWGLTHIQVKWMHDKWQSFKVFDIDFSVFAVKIVKKDQSIWIFNVF